jgi:hypothetical protein
MIIANNGVTRPYAIIHFRKDRAAKSIYCVSSKEGTEVPDLFGNHSENDEYIFLNYELQDSDEDIEWSFSNAEVQTSFRLTPEYRAYGRYGDDALLIEVSPDWNRLTLLFYKELGDHAAQLLNLWNLGLLEDTVAPVKR